MTKIENIEYTDEQYTTEADTKQIYRVACYIRVSTTEQKLHGLSLDAQRDTLKRYAKKHGLKIVGWYEDEGVSGRKLIRRRPALQRMLNDAQENKFDRIIFIKLDRYFRSVAEYHESQKILEKHNILWTATEEVYDLTTANGRYWVQQKLAMAEYEADNTGERIKLVNEYKVRDGQALSGSQNQVLAFTVMKDKDGVKRVVPDPETKDICMYFINHFLTYNGLRQAAWATNDKYNTHIHYNSFKKMLSDTKLYGKYRDNDFYCEPYIDKETFDKIQAKLAGNIKPPRSNRIYIFSGLLKCPDCGNNLPGTTSAKRKYYRKDGTKIEKDIRIKYYRCTKKLTSNLCSFNRSVNESKIEAQLLSRFDELIHDYIKDSEAADKRKQDNAAVKKIKALREELRRINRMYRNNALSDAEYDKEVKQINERIAKAEASLTPPEERDLGRYKELTSTNWLVLYENLNEENRRAFWRKYIKEIHVTSDAKLAGVKFF